MSAFLGVDAGGTRARAVLVSADGRVLGRGHSGAANFRTGTLDAASSEIAKAVQQAMGRGDAGGGSAVPEVEAAFIGSAGLEGPGGEELGRALLADSLRPRVLTIDSDAYIAWAGAFARQPGILICAGTGSVGLGITPAGRRHYVGGWGPLFGDEGSAYSIGREAIRVAMEISDGRRGDGVLLAALRRHADLADPAGRPFADVYREMTRWLYSADRRQVDIAAFAPAVDEAAEAGDEAARRILEQAGEQLARMAIALVRRFRAEDPAGAPAVSTAGSVLRSNRFVRQSFLHALAAAAPEAVVKPPRLPPEAGAALLAMAAAGLEPTAEVLAKLQTQLTPEAETLEAAAVTAVRGRADQRHGHRE